MAPSNSIATSGADFGCVYEAVLSQCGYLPSFVGPWQPIPPPYAARGPITDVGAALAGLTAQFPIDFLRQAGVVTRAPDGSEHLEPALTDATAAILPLRSMTDSPPLALLTGRGCLPRSGCALDYVLVDGWTRAHMKETAILFATPNIHDLLLLRALDLPATLTDGLAGLQRNEFIRRVEALNRVEVSAPWPASRLLRLTLLAWSMTTMEARPPAALAEVVDALGAVEDDLNVAILNAQAWALDTRHLNRLHRAVAAESQGVSRNWLLGHMTVMRAAELYFPADGPAMSYLDAQAELLDALAAADSEGRPRRRIVKTQGDYRRAIKAELIDPLEALAFAAPSPVIRAAMLFVADASRRLHELMPALLDAHRRGRATNRTGRRLVRNYTKTIRQFARVMPMVALARQGRA